MTDANAPLPIDDVLDAIDAALVDGSRLVVSAPPGAGKTTRVPLKLRTAAWAKGKKLILVQPRRIAARAAAERMATTLDEKVGQSVGLRTRMDVRTSANAAIEVVTEGVFTRQILSDPALEGVAGVLFDEFHERSLDADEGMAFALESQEVLRPDLRLIVMSATLPDNLTDTYFPAPVVHSDGRMHPVETRYLGGSTTTRIEDQMVSAIRMALAEEDGSVLAFLPGAAEIRRTIERLDPVPDGVRLCPLYGALSPSEQSAAIAPARSGERKVVIATDIAESAITIEGVRVVVDSGYARSPRFDTVIGATRLETVRIARANADQRRGRAGRTQPGVCYRLWREAEMGGFAPAPAPEIANADLSGLSLDLASWGAQSADELRWLDSPSSGRMAAARAMLVELGALDESGTLTPDGKRLARLPLPPPLAMMIVSAAPGETAETAALLAALLSERDLGGRSTDLAARLARLRNDTSPREQKMRRQAERWAREANGGAASDMDDIGQLLARVMPHRIARARPNSPGQYHLASGRGSFLDVSDPLCRHEWLLAADLVGGGANLRITLAAPLSFADLEAAGAVTTNEFAELDRETGKVRARRRRMIGEIIVDDTPLPRPSPAIIRTAYATAIADSGISALPEPGPIRDLVNRIQCARLALGDPWPEDIEQMISDRVEDWLPEPDSDRTSTPYSSSALAAALQTLLPWPLPQDLAREAPASWQSPAGAQIPIDYSSPEAPVIACQIQQVFGLQTQPTVCGGRVPLKLHLLSPARRPIAVTIDIAAFWVGGYADARKDMKARYPKHFWPENPSTETPSVRSIRLKSRD